MATTQTVFPIVRPGFRFDHEVIATMPVEQVARRLDIVVAEYNMQTNEAINLMLAAVLREPLLRFAGQVEFIRNQSRHRDRQWGKWRRRQARKQNRRRN